MMASGANNMCFESLIGLGLGAIDIDMEVKSEQDSEDESNFVSSECDEFDDEFIIPEARNPKNTSIEEFVINDISISNASQGNINECDIEVEDEAEVEIDEVTVRQQLVEVALDPSLLLYVHKDKNSAAVAKPQSDTELKHDATDCKHLLDAESRFTDCQTLPVIFDKEDLFPSVLKQSTKQKDTSVTAALRRVKRKPHREPLEPLTEIECSSENINNTINIDCNNSTVDKQVKCDSDNEENTNNDDCNAVFSDDAPSPCGSESDFKKQDGIMKKKQRRRSGLKSNTYIEKFLINRKGKRRKPSSKIKTAKLKRRNVKSALPQCEQEENKSEEHSCEKLMDEGKPELLCKSNEKGCLNGNESSSKVKCDDPKKIKKVKSKSLMFDEIESDYTIVGNNEPKVKVKRVRKRDKQSRLLGEIAAQYKPESFDCTECGRKFKEKSHLATHARAHINIRNFKCNKCGSLFKTKTNLFFHIKTHSDAPFTCEKCNKTYAERKTLMRHIRVVHSSQDTYSCNQCGREFKSMHNLNLHYTLHTGVKPFTCNICHKSFVYKSTYIAHMKGHEADDSFTCELCPNTYNSKAEFRRLCNHHSEARPWLCTVCGKGYPLKGTLKNHMKIHEPEKPFKCTECPKSFMKKQSFECHLKVHAGERPQFMCDQCSQSYFNVFALKRHYLKHTSERRFVCEVCQKAFWMKDALKVHMRTHSSVKLFPCVKCHKAFAHKHTLDAHLRTHLDVEPYSCNVCQKTFIHKYNLVRHERQHSSSTVPVIPPLVVPPEHQTVPISITVVPTAISPSNTLHTYTINTCL